jgi:ribose transport system permease protein
MNPNLGMRLKKFISVYSLVLIPYVGAVILVIVGEFMVPGFAEINHVLNLLKVSALLGVIVLAQSMVIIAGGEGIDLSVGAIASISAIMSAVIINGKDLNLLLALPAVLLAGFLLGSINGIGIAYFGIPPLVMTLGMSSVIDGLVLIYSGGFIIRGNASKLLITLAGGQSIPNVPNMLLVWIVIILISLFVFNRTKSGVTLYGVGANEMTAELNGVRSKRVRALAYAIGGSIAALGGMFLLGYNAGLPFMGMGAPYVLPSVAASVIGGISLAGGSGSYLGAAGGSILLTTLNALLVTWKGEGGRQIGFGMVLIVLLAIYGQRSKS